MGSVRDGPCVDEVRRGAVAGLVDRMCLIRWKYPLRYPSGRRYALGITVRCIRTCVRVSRVLGDVGGSSGAGGVSGCEGDRPILDVGECRAVPVSLRIL